MNIPYEMFLTIQKHLTCRKDRIHNRLQAKKDETCSEEQVTTFQNKNNMTNAMTSLMQNLPRRKGRPVQEERCLKMQY